MQENEILEEIHRIRAAHAAECGYDVNPMFARMDADLKRLQAEGWRVVSPVPRENESDGVLREEPPKK